jgi:hypothetical protein
VDTLYNPTADKVFLIGGGRVESGKSLAIHFEVAACIT